MNIAVVGAGLAGLAVTWHLLKIGAEVTVFDFGEGASHASTGLLHPYPGKKALKTHFADEGMQAALELLELASHERPCFEKNGILRYAVDDAQRTLFGRDSIFIKEGISVYSRVYLEELKKVCKNAKVINAPIQSIDELSMFDNSVITVGPETSQFFDIPLKRTIGQSLVCCWKKRLPHALLGGVHITPTEDPDYCQVGSTYEYTSEPSKQKALELIDRLEKIYPEARSLEIVEIRCGVRASPKLGYMPILRKMDRKTWVFTGLGSRGLIYHSLFARKLVYALQFGSDSVNMSRL